MDALGLGSILDFGSTIIDKIFPDKDKANAAKLELAKLAQTGELDELGIRMKAIVAEAQSEHWLAANWRPITMLSFTAIIVNNYILVPYLQTFGVFAVMLELPPDMWDLLKLGLGGYVVGRSGEKMMKAYKG